jgi:23S rRNA (guanosine2251-2'-O)-methyltransferase
MNKYTKRAPPLKEKSDYYLFGLHAVKAAIENPKRQKHELWISQNAKSKVLTSSKSLNIPIFNLDKLKNLPIPKDKVHQGAILKVSPLKQPSHPNEINISGNKNVIIILDKVSDPQNVGAIIRSSLFFNCNVVINALHGGSSENGSLVKTASGAFEYVHYLQVKNIVQTIKDLKKIGFLIIGLDETSKIKISSVDKGNNNIAFVFGAEGKGIRRLTKEYCDELASIDGTNYFSSLNVSTAVGITLFSIQTNDLTNF